MFGYLQRQQTVYVIPLKTINVVSYSKFSKPWARQGQDGFGAGNNHRLLSTDRVTFHFAVSQVTVSTEVYNSNISFSN